VARPASFLGRLAVSVEMMGLPRFARRGGGPAGVTSPLRIGGLIRLKHPGRIPSRGFRSCIGILRLKESYGAERVDVACSRALALGTRSYPSVVTILKNR
jgi:hypothetical protein